MEALDVSGLVNKFKLGMDCALSEWFDKEKEVYKFEGEERNRYEMLEYYKKLVLDYPVATIEVPLTRTTLKVL